MGVGILRHQIVREMAANQERLLKTQEIYDLVASTGIPGFDPQAHAGPQPGEPGILRPGRDES